MFKDIIKIPLIICCLYIKIALCNILHCVPPASQLSASLSVSSEHGCFCSTNKCGLEISILMHCLFKRARGQEWRRYQPAIHHGHDTLSPALPHLQAMLYRTNTSPQGRAVIHFPVLCIRASWISPHSTCSPAVEGLQGVLFFCNMKVRMSGSYHIMMLISSSTHFLCSLTWPFNVWS